MANFILPRTGHLYLRKNAGNHDHKQKSGNLGDYIYIFMDEQRRAQEHARFIERCENDYDESANTPMDLAQKPRMGYFCFCSNLDTEPKEIYLGYKEHWDIEECFNYLKNSVRAESSHAHNNEYFRGWAFLNHISLLYYYDRQNGKNAESEYAGRNGSAAKAGEPSEKARDPQEKSDPFSVPDRGRKPAKMRGNLNRLALPNLVHPSYNSLGSVLLF